MLSLLAVVVGAGVVAWFLFMREPCASNTLSASRWLLLAWSFIFLMALFSPVQFYQLGVSLATVGYCLAWIGSFCLGDLFGFRRRASQFRTAAFQRIPVWSHRASRRAIILDICSGAGLLYMAYAMIVRTIRGADGVSIAATLRISNAVDGSFVFTLMAFCAFAGLVTATVRLSAAILSGRRIGYRPLMGMLCFGAPYVAMAGRHVVLITLVTLTVVIGASIQIRQVHYRYLSAMVRGMVGFLVLAVLYTTAIITGRTVNWSGTVDNKIRLMSLMFRGTLDKDVVESLRPMGPLFPMAVETYLYFTPQLYMLDKALWSSGNTPYAWGVYEFPYISRRIAQVTGVDVFGDAVQRAESVYTDDGLSPHMFVTAAFDTWFDFGLGLGLVFVFACGYLTGRSRCLAVSNGSPAMIALQGLMCAGAVMTILYSPFSECGFAFPLIWHLATGRHLLVPGSATTGPIDAGTRLKIRVMEPPVAPPRRRERRGT